MAPMPPPDHLQRLGIAPPRQAGPAEEAGADRFDLVEAELAQPDDVEERAQLCRDLFLADDRRPRVVRLAGVASQHQA